MERQVPKPTELEVASPEPQAQSHLKHSPLPEVPDT